MGYTGVGTALMGWMNTFLLSSLGTSPWSASIVLAIYSERLLFVAALGSSVALAMSLWAPSILVSGTSFFLTGFLFAGLLPTSLATANRDFPELAGTVTAVLITFGSIGRTIVPGFVGAVADVSNVTVGLRWLMVISAAMVLAGWMMQWGKPKAKH